MKTIAISGASGFVGSSLNKYFSNLNYKVISISRDVLNNQEKLNEVLEEANELLQIDNFTCVIE